MSMAAASLPTAVRTTVGACINNSRMLAQGAVDKTRKVARRIFAVLNQVRKATGPESTAPIKVNFAKLRHTLRPRFLWLVSYGMLCGEQCTQIRPTEKRGGRGGENVGA